MAATSAGPISQVCWVVPDIEAGERLLGRLLGVPAWTPMGEVRFGPDEATHRGRPADFSARVSLGWSGDLQVELIEPVAGESLYAEFLGEHPAGGLHHVAIETDDVDATVRESGLEVLSEGTMAGGLMRFAYLDGAAHGAPFVEVVWLSNDMRRMFAAMKGDGPRPVPATVVAWHALAQSRDPAGLDALLADDCVFRSPAVHSPQVGKQLTTAYLAAALVVLGPTLTYSREWWAEDSAVLHFTADLDGVVVEGVDMITWAEDGRITEFTVMVRPVKGLHTLMERMAAQLMG